MEKNKDIPKAVIEAAKGLGEKIVFQHSKKGYAVFIVCTPREEGGIVLPTGYPRVILYKKNEVKVIASSDSLDWL